MPRADADDPWEYIFPSRCYALAGLQLHLSFEDHLTSPVPLNRHRLRRLGTQLPEGARIAPGRPLDAFAVGSRGWLRTTRWRGCGQGCTRAGPREARIRITLFRWSPFGRLAGALWTSYDASFPAIGWRR